MQLSMLDGLDRYSLRRVLPSDADHVARSRPVLNTQPTDRHIAPATGPLDEGEQRSPQRLSDRKIRRMNIQKALCLCASEARGQCSQENE